MQWKTFIETKIYIIHVLNKKIVLKLFSNLPHLSLIVNFAEIVIKINYLTRFWWDDKQCPKFKKILVNISVEFQGNPPPSQIFQWKFDLTVIRTYNVGKDHPTSPESLPSVYTRGLISINPFLMPEIC